MGSLVQWCIPVAPILRGLRQEYLKFENALGYTRPCLKNVPHTLYIYNGILFNHKK